MPSLQAIRVVLARPTHPGNVGGAARAIKNMGLERLYVAAPVNYDGPQAEARAADAADVLARATVCDSLDEAIRDCHFVAGTTARSRRIDWPALDPAACAARLLDEARRGPVALVFGQERTGLTNAELDRCHALVHIPASPAYSSLNLVCAVQILAYEIYRAASMERSTPAAPREPPASEAEMSRFYRHLEAVLIRVQFLDPANPRLLLRRLRRLFNRAQPDRNEVNILRGILASVERAVGKLDSNGKE